MTSEGANSCRIKIVATGDSFITRRICQNTESFQVLAGVLQEADVRFTNLETVIRRNEGFPSAQSGGTWASSPPEVLEDLCAYGFNTMAWANNHTLDYSYGGLSATAGYLDKYGIVHAGVGENLAEANAIRYMDLPAGRVALVAVTSSFHESWRAGEQRKDGPGRPGVNPLRFRTVNKVSKDRLEQLKSIAEECQLNAAYNERLKEGFVVAEKDGAFWFGGQLFAETETAEDIGQVTTAHPGDLARLVGSIKEARRQADVVLVSVHAHEAKGVHNDRPADFLVQFARACVDAGADSVIGHGPHILRGVEIYKNRPIFYSLGNFIFQNESVQWQPADFYEKYGLDSSLTVSELFAARSNNGTRGLGSKRPVWHSVVAEWSFANGRLEGMSLVPVELGFGLPTYKMGVPVITENTAPLEEIAALSEEFGTRIEIREGRGHVRLG